MRIDHIAVAVKSVDDAADRLSLLLGYRKTTEKVTNSQQQVTVLFIGKEGSVDIKLIEPAAPNSPLWEHLKKGGGLHHVCFKVPDVMTASEDLVSKGGRLVKQPAPGEAFDDHLIAFIYLGLGLTIELIDTDARRSGLK